MRSICDGVAKVAGVKKRAITGPAKVFDGEEACFAALQERQIKAGDIVVVRGEGPVGGPGMREMLSVTAALAGHWHRLDSQEAPAELSARGARTKK